MIRSLIIRILVVTAIVLFSNDIGSAHELYAPLSSMCCGGKVLSREKEVSLCCGNSVFDPTEEMCCSDKVLKLPPNPPDMPLPPLVPTGHFRPGAPVFFSALSLMYGCCGDSLFTVRNQLCCNGKVVDRPVDEPGQPPTFYSCCGETVYNVTGEDCCRGHIQPKTKSSEGCCGDKIIDYAESICCTEDFANVSETPVVFDREEPDVSCCGRQKINYKNEICCGGKVIPVPGDAIERSRASCCGENLWMLNRSEICCDGKVLPRNSFEEACCDNEIFNFDSHICCDGVVLPKKGLETYCCGSKIYEATENTCCYSNFTIVSLGNNLDEMACCE